MSVTGPYANGLYPIVRRIRRPLVVEGTPPAVVGNVEPLKPGAAIPQPASAETADKASPAEPVVAAPVVVGDVEPVQPVAATPETASGEVVAAPVVGDSVEPVQPVAATPVVEPAAVAEPAKPSEAKPARKRKGR